jgi:hypothetical protein
MKIKPGVYADISIEYIRKENVYLLPLSALLSGDKEVMVNENGTARKRAITIGEKNGTRFEMIAGVRPDELVLVEGNYDLKEGTTIVMSGDKK